MSTDVIIIGGGPAGSALGCYLSMAGISNVILEKALHPRPHVGESLVPITTRYFKELGVIPTLNNGGYVRKYGAAWHPPSGRDVVSIRFREIPQAGVDQGYSYHVDRSKFDLMLFKRAEELGSKVYEGVHVREVLFTDGYASGVSCKFGDEAVRLDAKLIVDATGRNTLLGQQLDFKKNDPIFNQFAIHGWFEGLDRTICGDEVADYIHIYFLKATERGWAWQIPITEDVTSVGVVAERDLFRQSRKDVPGWFDAQVASHPTLTNAMGDVRQVKAFESEGDYSYTLKLFAGDGFLIVGDAARFVDPIFSSGVSVAMASARFARDAIAQALETGDCSYNAFKAYERKLRAGVEIWYDFIRLYYKLLPMFTYFISRDEYRADLLTLLSGDVYDQQEAPVLRKMRELVETVQSTDNHIFKPYLTSMPID